MRRLLTLTLALCGALSAQSLTSTTTTGAVTPDSPSLQLASTSGAAVGYELYVDREAMIITAVGSGAVTVKRGQEGTAATSHLSGSTVYVGPSRFFSPNDLNGSGCTNKAAVGETLLSVRSGSRWTCQASGVWLAVGLATVPFTDDGTTVTFAPNRSIAIGATAPNGGLGQTTIPASGPIASPGLYGGVFRPLMTALTAGASAAIQIVSDSTGSGTTRWAYLTTQWLAAKFPAYTVRYLAWNDTNQAFDATTIQTGAAGERWAVFTGVRSAQIPPSDMPGITGDVDIQVKLAPRSWRETVASTDQTILARFGGAGSRAFRFQLLRSSGVLEWQWTSDGTNLVTNDSTVATTDVGAGVAQWVRVTQQMNDGAGHNLVKFYTSSDGTTWTQLGATVTNAGTTSLYNGAGLAAVNWEIGARGGTAQPLFGSINNVRILSGINGYPIAPMNIDAWQPVDTSVTFSGAPELTIVNAVLTGSGIDYWINSGDSTRFPKATQNWGQLVAIVNLGHNEFASVNTAYGPSFLTRYASLVTQLKTQLPMARVAVLTQNPRISPSATQDTRSEQIRAGQLSAWALLNGHAVIDTYSAFMLDSRGLSTLIDSGGIHPTDSAGSPLWAAVVEGVMLLDSPKVQ